MPKKQRIVHFEIMRTIAMFFIVLFFQDFKDTHFF